MNPNNELENDRVTVSKLQVALQAQAGFIQSELTEISLKDDTQTREGLWQLLQQVLQALQRAEPYWTHVLATSQTFPALDEAQAVFDRFSDWERSKFSAETLTNIEGKITQNTVLSEVNEGPPAYIVVTLLIGTAHDRPFFDSIHSRQGLKDVLEKIASMRSDYLMVLELLWSPQAPTDSLTENQMAMDYADLIAIA